MDRDEFERIKAAEKEHLRKVRALKQQLGEAQRQKRLADAVQAMDTEALGSAFDEALREVQMESALSEARLDVAMEGAADRERAEKERLDREQFEADRRKAAADDLVRQMKEEMAASKSDGRPDSASPASKPDSGEATENTPRPDAPHKTIGRPRRTDG